MVAHLDWLFECVELEFRGRVRHAFWAKLLPFEAVANRLLPTVETGVPVMTHAGVSELARALHADLPCGDDPLADSLAFNDDAAANDHGVIDLDSLATSAADAWVAVESAECPYGSQNEGNDDSAVAAAACADHVGSGLWLDRVMSRAIGGVALCCARLEAILRILGEYANSDDVSSTEALISRLRLIVRTAVFSSPPAHFTLMLELWMLRHFSLFSSMQVRAAVMIGHAVAAAAALNDSKFGGDNSARCESAVSRLVRSPWWSSRSTTFRSFVKSCQQLQVKYTSLLVGRLSVFGLSFTA